MTTKICTGCNTDKELDEFSPRIDGVLGRASRCKECRRKDGEGYAPEYNKRRRVRYRNEEIKTAHRKYMRTYREANKEILMEKNKNRYSIMKKTIIERYGGKCKCCEEDQIEFLAIDHIDGHGKEERTKIGSTGVFRKLFRSKEPIYGYRILCHNCNSALGFRGYCPHNNL